MLWTMSRTVSALDGQPLDAHTAFVAEHHIVCPLPNPERSGPCCLATRGFAGSKLRVLKHPSLEWSLQCGIRPCSVTSPVWVGEHAKIQSGFAIPSTRRRIRSRRVCIVGRGVVIVAFVSGKVACVASEIVASRQPRRFMVQPHSCRTRRSRRQLSRPHRSCMHFSVQPAHVSYSHESSSIVAVAS